MIQWELEMQKMQKNIMNNKMPAVLYSGFLRGKCGQGQQEKADKSDKSADWTNGFVCGFVL